MTERERSALTILLLLVVINAIVWMSHYVIAALGAEQQICQLEPGGEGWHYRTKIEPKPDIKCWYDGPRMKPRSELYWAEAPAIPPMEINRPPWAKPERFDGDTNTR